MTSAEHPAGKDPLDLQTSVVLLLVPAQLVDVTTGGGGTPQQLVTSMEEASKGQLGWTIPWSCSQPRWLHHVFSTSRPAPPGFGYPGEVTRSREGHATPLLVWKSCIGGLEQSP